MWSIADSYFAKFLRGPTPFKTGSNGSLPPASHTWQNSLESLTSLAKLEDDWDGQDAEAPAGDLIDSALEFAEALRSANVQLPCRVVASVNGTVIFEWQPRSGIYADAEIVELGLAELSWKEKDLRIQLAKIASRTLYGRE